MVNFGKFLLSIKLILVGSILSAQAVADRPMVAEGGECLIYAMSLWEEAYKVKNSGFSMNLRVSGEDKAMQDLAEGSIQMALLARDAMPDELSAFRTKWGYMPTRVAVAMDALVMLVNKNNPLKAIRIEEADAIYSVNRPMGWPKDILTWGDLGVHDPSWTDRAIVRYGRTRDSSVFGLILMYFPGMIPRMPIRLLPDGMAVAEALASDSDGICPANLVEEFASTRALPMCPTGSKVAVAPTPDSVSSGTYPYSRCLYVYINKHPRTGVAQSVKEFLVFALSSEGQQLVKAAGQAPLSKDVNALSMLKVTGAFNIAPSAIR